MDLVYEQHVARLQIREDGGEVAGALDRRSGRRSNLSTELVGHHGGERRLAQTRRSREDHVVQALPTVLSRFDEDSQALLDMFLAAIIIEGLRSQRALNL